MKKTVKKLSLVVIIAMLFQVLVPMLSFAGQEVTIDFSDGNVEGNTVTFYIGEGDEEVAVTATLDNTYPIVENEVTMDVDNFLTGLTFTNFNPDTMNVKLYEPEGFQVYFRVEGNTLIRDSEGGYPTNVKFKIEAKNQGGEDEPGPGEFIPFDGNATFVWNDNGKLCYHKFTDLAPWGTKEINYIKASEITDQSGNNGTYTFGQSDADWVMTRDLFDEEGQIWQDILDREILIEDYNVDANLARLILYGMEPPEFAIALGLLTQEQVRDARDAGIEQEVVDGALAEAGIDPLWGISINGIYFGKGANSISTNEDNNFLVTIYDEEKYIAASVSENIEDYAYFPGFWLTNTYNSNIDISETTKENPAFIEAYLLNTTVTFRNSELSPRFVSVEPLDVNQNAITVNDKGNGVFEVEFGSNYYDRVVFEIKDAEGITHYAMIARTAIQVEDNFAPGVDDQKLYADIYYPTEEYDENSFQVVATAIYKDGNEKIQILDSVDIIDHSWNGNWGDNLGKKIDGGHNLSMSEFILDCEGDMVGAYFTVIKKGSLGENEYAGTFSGSGRGAYYDIRDRDIIYTK